MEMKMKMERISLMILGLLTSAAFAQDEAVFIAPVVERFGVEYYDSGEKRYGIFTWQVTWQQAKELCHARNGSLVEYLDTKTPEFIGRALAESAVGYSALWIGGEFLPRKDGSGVWMWTNSQRPIDTKVDQVSQFPMTSWPFWVDRPKTTGHTSMCLATDRNLHHQPLIVAAPCTKKKAFICALPNAGGKGPPIEVGPPIVIAPKRFHLFHAEVTWQKALSKCREIGMQLAALTTESEFRIIGNRMMRSRPIIENAWTSGKFENNEWTWISNMQPINTDEHESDAEHPYPWYRPDDIIMEGCLLADRHVCDHFVYVEAKCDRRRNYICEEEVYKESVEPPLVRVPGTDYWISTYPVAWLKAQLICKSCLGGNLLQLQETKEGVAEHLTMLYTAMALTLQKEIRHIWIGGYLFKKKFKWTTDPNTEPGDEQALNSTLYDELHDGGMRGRLNYCQVNFTLDDYLLEDKCLNMDRENEKEFFMFGLKCRYSQHYICKAPHDANIIASCEDDGFGKMTSEITILEAKEKRLDIQRPTTSETMTPKTILTLSTIKGPIKTEITQPLNSSDTTVESTTSQGLMSPVFRLLRTTNNTVSEATMPWVPVGGYDGYWLNTENTNWKDANISCGTCLGGDLLQLTASDHGQVEQLRIIREAMWKTLTNKLKSIWLGSFELSQNSKWIPNIPNASSVDDIAQPRLEIYKGKLESSPPKCAYLIWKRDYLRVLGSKCSLRRHAICLTRINVTVGLN